MTTPEEDEAWRLIVDRYDETAVRDPDHPGEVPGADEGAPVTDEGAQDRGTPDPGTSGAPSEFFAPEPVPEPTPAPTPEPEEDRFVPPPPPPAPEVSRGRRVAWATILGVPLCFFLAALTGRPIPGTFAGLLAVGLVAAFVYLVATLPREPRDPWDDGSRV